LLEELLEVLMVMVKAAGCLVSPPSNGSKEWVAKATDALIGVDVIIFFPLLWCEPRVK